MKVEEYMIQNYESFLYEEEKSKATIDKYMRDIYAFYNFLSEDKYISKENLVTYKRSLNDMYKLSSINSMLVALNGFLEFLNLAKFKLKLHKIHRKSFYEEERELTKEEYKRLLLVAERKENERLFFLLQTICSTGIRVSEHKFITIEAVKKGSVTITNKGKSRMILLPKKLKKQLLTYCKEKQIKQGCVFITKSGKPLDRSNIWHSMKALCDEAQVNRNKVFPHNLRHLFALTYYRLQKDVVRLADILGHTSIDTTRIYTMTSSFEYQKALSKMDLLITT